jgi:hypothetical protein
MMMLMMEKHLLAEGAKKRGKGKRLHGHAGEASTSWMEPTPT